MACDRRDITQNLQIELLLWKQGKGPEGHPLMLFVGWSEKPFTISRVTRRGVEKISATLVP